MKKPKIDSYIKFLEDKKFFILGAAALIFVIYKILLFCIFNNLCFSPPLLNLVLFILGFSIFVLSYRISFNLNESRRIALFFLITLLIQLFANLQFFGDWEHKRASVAHDSIGYYNLAVLGAEKGPIYFIENYHALVKWDTDPEEVIEESPIVPLDVFILSDFSGSKPVKADVEDKLKRLGIYEWGVEKLDWDKGLSSDLYDNRPAFQPPLWPIILSFFIFLFGENYFSTLIGYMLISSLVPVALYYWVKRFWDTKAAIQTTFLFILVPAFIIERINRINNDAPVVLFVIVSTYLFITSLENRSLKIASVSGFLFSSCFLIKFTTLNLYVAFLVLVLLRFGYRGLKHYIVFFMSSLVLPFFLMVFDYYFFLNIITSSSVLEVSVAKAMQISGTSRLNYTAVQFTKELIHLGIPVIFLLFLGALRLLPLRMEWSDKINLVFLLMLLFSGLEFVFGMARYLLPFLSLTMGIVAKELHYSKARDRFILFIFIICAIQKFLFMVLP